MNDHAHGEPTRLIYLENLLGHHLTVKTVTTEVHWVSRQTVHHPDLATNLFLAMDLPSAWWAERHANLLGEWVKEFDVSTLSFRLAHGIQ